MLVELALFFTLASVLTTAAVMVGNLIRARFWLGLPIGLLILAIAGWLTSRITHDPAAGTTLPVVSIIVGTFAPLAEAALYLAAAPKSNSAMRAYGAASQAVRETGNLPVPLHLRNAVTGLMRRMGYGKGYRYAHDYEGGRVEQQHLPDELKDRRFYRPTDRDR